MLSAGCWVLVATRSKLQPEYIATSCSEFTIMIDLARVRAETVGVNHCIHLNNAGSGLMPDGVVSAIKDYIDLEARMGGYEAASQEAERLTQVYHSVARLMNCAPEEIALLENATMAWDMAFYSFVISKNLQPGDKILTVNAEYAANYVAYLQMKKRYGIEIEIIPDDEFGATDANALEAMIDDRVKLISITYIPTNGGLVNPAEAIGRIAKAHGIPYLLDGCQAPGQMPVDVQKLGCDMFSATGRKFLRGPRGTGFLYIRKGLLEEIEPFFVDHFAAEWTSPETYELRHDARRFENWENAYALRLGLGVAVDYALELGLKNIQKRAWGLAADIRNELAQIPGVELYDIGQEKCAIVTFNLRNLTSAEVRAKLSTKNINVSSSGPSSTLLDATRRGLSNIVRVSPHYYNSEPEIEQFIAAVRELATD